MKIIKVFNTLLLTAILGCPTSILACHEKINFDENQITECLNNVLESSISNVITIPPNQNEPRTVYVYTRPMFDGKESFRYRGKEYKSIFALLENIGSIFGA